jgi:DNA-directed RNA polymerase specialized sigma24 family protein
MTNQAIANKRLLHEAAVTERFLDGPNEESFGELFNVFTPQLVAFFRARGCQTVAEDLAQGVMFTVYRKADQIRDRSLFRAWIFKIARNTISRQFGKQTRELDTVDLADVPERLVASGNKGAGTPAFELDGLLGFPRERSPDAALHRAVGVSRDSRRPVDPDWNGTVESV